MRLTRMFGWALVFFPLWIQAESEPPTQLLIKQVPLTVNGKTVMRYTIEQPDGTWGYVGKQGQWFDAVVKNETSVPTVLHWHGLVVPNNQDGVPNITQPPIMPGQSYHYHFRLNQAGTYWMHSHYQLQLQDGMVAPLIIEPKTSEKTAEQSVLMFLSDFSYQSAQAIFKGLRKGMQMSSMSMPMKAGPDLADVHYDALLTNHQTLANPPIIRVKPGTWVRLRIIDGAAATNFGIDLGQLKGQLVAVDGEPIQSLTQSTFTLALGQRMDIIVQIPEGEGAYPILAQGEGTDLQTGLVLATSKAVIPKLSQQSKTLMGPVTMDQESQLKALHPLAKRSIDKALTVNLGGNMQDYTWTFNGQIWPQYTPLIGQSGQRVAITFKNQTGMSHPMHLHGHVFQVVAINGKSLSGALRDTVLVPAHGSVTIIFDANNPGKWMIHCHVLYHSEGGMMGIYEEIPKH